MKYDFSSMDYSDLLRMEFNLEIELQDRMSKMVMDGEIENIIEQLDSIRIEKEERDL